MEYLNHNDFVLTQQDGENGEKIFIGGGYTIDSFLLQNDTPVMTTFNNIDDKFTGGKQVSSPFENLAVPAGLFFINQKMPKHNYKEKNGYNNMLTDDIHDKLFDLINYDNKQKQLNKKKITKKNTNYLIKHKKTFKNKNKLN